MKKEITALLLAATAWAEAAVVFSADFEAATQPGGAGTAIEHGGSVADGFAASAFTPGAGIGVFRLDPSVTNDLFISEAAGTNPASTLEQAVAANAYFEFGATAGEPVDFGRLGFAMRGHGSTQTGYITVRSSADGYTANLATVSGAMNSKHSASANLAAAGGFNGLTNVVFRFYVYDEYEGSNNRRLGIDDIELSLLEEPFHTYPPNGSATYQTIPYLQWEDAVENPFPGRYQIQIARDTEFAEVLDEDTIPALINHYVPAREFEPQTLYWRVRYLDEEGGEGSWTAPWSLEIQPMPTVVDVPPGSDWHAIQGYLAQALASAPAELRFAPETTYHVVRDPAHDAFLRIHQQGNILVNGQGCTFVITDQAGTKCDFFYGRGATGPIQFKDFTVDYAPDSLAHFGGQVVDIEYFAYPDCAFTIQVDPGTYPSPDPLLDDLKLGIVLEPGTLQRWHAIDASPRLEVNETLAEAAANSAHGPHTFRFSPASNRQYFYDHLAPGHWFVMTERGGDLFYVYQSCPDLVINNVTSKACRGRAFIPRKNCERLRVVNNRILRTGNRALGMTSGGINDHSGGAANLSLTNWFPWWEGNTLEYNADDMYNGHNDRCVFRNNTLRGPFRNAIWIHHDRQWIEGNTVFHAGTRGLTMTPGGLDEQTAHVVNTAIIRNNTFVQPRLNGLLMDSNTNLPPDSSGDYYHTDILIEGNIWHDHLKYEAISLNFGKRVTVRNNHVDGTAVPFVYGNDPARAIGIYVAASDGVLIQNNEVWDPRIAPDKRIVVAAGAANVGVEPGPEAAPPEIATSREGGAMRLSWPPKYWGWVAQSNAAGLAEAHEWFDIDGSHSETILETAPGQGPVFYRLRQP